MLSHEDNARHFRRFPISVPILPRNGFDAFFIKQCFWIVGCNLKISHQLCKSVFERIRLNKHAKRDLVLILQSLTNVASELSLIDHDLREQSANVNFRLLALAQFT